jgi:hypothetical protein
MTGYRPVAAALAELRPGAAWILRGNDLEWLDATQTQPTEAEVAAKITEQSAKAEIDKYRAAVQAHIDATAKSRGYNDGAAMAGYVVSAVPPWKAEAEVFVAWRDQVWLAVFEMLAQIQSGDMEAPESTGALIGWLPQIEWP